MDPTKSSGATSSTDSEFCYHIPPTKILDLVKSKETCEKTILGFFFDLIEKRLIFEFFEDPLAIISEFCAHIHESYKSPTYFCYLKSKINELVSDFCPTKPSGDEPLKDSPPIFGLTGPEYIDHKMAEIIIEFLGENIDTE